MPRNKRIASTKRAVKPAVANPYGSAGGMPDDSNIITTDTVTTDNINVVAADIIAADAAANGAEPAGDLPAVAPENVPVALASTTTDKRAGRAAAQAAVARFYAGASLPFKSAFAKLSAVNFGLQRPGPSGHGTERQAGLLYAMLTYSGGNIDPAGNFTRGGFDVPAALAFSPDDMRKLGLAADATVPAMPESGGLSNMLGLAVRFVSGATDGRDARNARYCIDRTHAVPLLRANFGDTAVALLDSIVPPA